MIGCETLWCKCYKWNQGRDLAMSLSGEALSRLVRGMVRRPEELSHPPAEGRRRGVLFQVRGLPAEPAPGKEERLLRARSPRKLRST